MPETTTAPPETASEENKPLAFTLKSEYCEYLKGRGLTEDTCKLFGVGLCASKGSMAGRVVIPIHNPKAELVAYIGRAVDGSEPKFKIPAGFHMSRELFNYHRAGGKVVTIVEGPFDCLHLTQNGYPNVVALLGKSLSDSQAELICTKWKGATLMLDGDTAGSEASEKITLALSKRIYVRRIELERGKDPDNYDKASLERLMK